MMNTAIRAARSASQVILMHLDRLDRIEVETKGRRDYVTKVDRVAEEIIVDTLLNAYPDHGILAEESGRRQGNEYTWIIDPLDGTTNYIHGYPQFCVSIALRHRNQLEHGVIFDPLRNELFTASRGGGAQMNNRRIRVSGIRRLDEALLGTGFPFKELENLDIWLRTFKALLPKTSGIRRAGSAALDLAQVAAGRFDGFWEMGLNPWDMAAGCLLIREAGGLVSDFNGGQEFLSSGNVVCANPHLFNTLLNVISTRAG